MQNPDKTTSVKSKVTGESGTRPDAIVKPIDQQREENIMKPNTRIIIGVYIVLFVLGVGTGYLLAGRPALFRSSSSAKQTVVTSGKIVGSTDTKTFKDSAEGTLEKGGLGGEGSHKLIRAGGPSQTAYLVSSVVDLDQYVGKKVRVWGQTMAAETVPWLMDVGKIEILSE